MSVTITSIPEVPKFQFIEPHPLLSMLPMAQPIEITAMQHSILNVGVQEPLRVWRDSKGKQWLIDGRCRQAAAELAFNSKVLSDPPEPAVAANGVALQPETDEFQGTIDDVYNYLKLKMTRKDYTQGQRSAIGVKLYYFEYKKSHSGRLPNPQAEVEGEGALTAEELAKINGVNSYYIVICRQLYREAPDLLDQVASGVLPPAKAKAALAERQRVASPDLPGDIREEEEDGVDKRSDGGDSYTDSDGIPVPDILVAVWQDKAAFGALRTQLSGIRAKIQAVASSKAGGGIEEDVIDKQVEAVMKHLHGAEPLVVCPACNGHGRQKFQRDACGTCGGKGYLTRQDKRRLSVVVTSPDGSEG